jgi:hypothetical protein
MPGADPRATPPARPVLAGHRAVAALWFPHDWFDEAARRRRIVAAWRPGCGAWRFAQGDLLRFAEEVVIDCDASPGWPLAEVAGLLCSAALAPADLAGQAHADVLLARGATWQRLHLAAATPIDPADWFDVPRTLVDTFDLRPPEAERRVVAPPARDVRAVLGPAVPAAPHAGGQRLLDALAQRSARGGRTPRPASPHEAFRTDLHGGAVKVAAVVAAAILALAAIGVLVLGPDSGRGFGPHDLPPSLLSAGGALVVLLMRQGRGASGAPGTTTAARPGASRVASPAARALRTLPARLQARMLPRRWREWAARLALTTGLGQLLGAQHSAYMRRMLRMFDEGRLDEALRHAIPLGGQEPSLGQSFGALGPRADLALHGARRARTSIGLDDTLQAHLRTLYRRSFEQLDRQGRIDEAVFTLAELLGVRQQALDYLEKHGRFAQAAELALGWDMPAAQIVRLHALAGDWRVAVLCARRDNAFAAAVALLEKRWPDAGARLRGEWADSLAAQGRWLEAVHALWPITAERPRAGAWLQVAEDGGGALAARALALRAQCLPATLASRIDAIHTLRDDVSLRHERAALAQELLGLRAPIDPAARRLAALIVGALIADHAGPDAIAILDDKTLRRVAYLAGDAALSADLPGGTLTRHAPAPIATRTAPAEFGAPAAGLHAVVDAVPLPDGEFLVALGEGGAVRVDAQGRWRARFAVPAQRLVPARDGRGALALARRDGRWRVSRLQLAGGQAVDLGTHEFDAFAAGYDDAGWSVAVGRRVQLLDPTGDLRETSWQVPDLPGDVLVIDVDDDTERWLLRDADGGLQQWTYALPARRLRSRDPVPEAGPHAVARRFASGIGMVEFWLDHPDAGHAQIARLVSPDSQDVLVPWADETAILAMAGSWMAWREAPPQGVADAPIALVNIETGRVDARWHWPATARVGLRRVGSTWLVFDDQGRLAALDVLGGRQQSLSLR